MEIGKAYAFFNCRASKGKIEAELPTLRKLAKIPSNLELFLTNDIRDLRAEQDLIAIAKKAQDSGIRYFMEAKLPDKTNEETALELSDILEQAYQSPLYSQGEPFICDIGYKDNGEYISLNRE